MVEPYHFFSTLAQASAAIVGFVVAVGTVLYSLERQRVARHTEDYQRGILEFKNEYQPALIFLSKLLETKNFGLDDSGLPPEIHDAKSPDEMSRIIDNVETDYPLTKELQAHIQRCYLTVLKIGPEGDSSITDKELTELEESISYFREQTIAGKQLRDLAEELTGEPVEKGSLLKIEYLNESIEVFDQYYAGKIREWYETVDNQHSYVLGPEAKFTDEPEDLRVTGDNIYTLQALSRRMSESMRIISKNSQWASIRYESGIRPIIKISTYLIVFGVILPTSFLLAIPVFLPWWFVLGAQVFLLIAVLVFTVVLVRVLMGSSNPDTPLADTEQLDRVSRWVVEGLPDIPF